MVSYGFTQTGVILCYQTDTKYAHTQQNSKIFVFCSATCRRPIRGAAGRPVISSDLWNDENSLFSPKSTKTSSYSYTESHIVNRVNSLPPSTSLTSSTSSSSTSRLLSAAPPAGQTKATRRSVSLWVKLFLLVVVAVFLFLFYQAMETNSSSPFDTPAEGVGSTA